MWPTYFEISSEPRNETLVTYIKCKKAGMVRDDCANEKCWPCTNESDFMDATKQLSSMTGWITFPVTAVWLWKLWFGWRSRWQRTSVTEEHVCTMQPSNTRISVANTLRHHEPLFCMTASKRCQRWITTHLLFRIYWKDMGTLIEKKNEWDKEVKCTVCGHVKWKWYT